VTVEIRDGRFREVVGETAELERLATGFAFTEGPVWHPVKRHLVFSDIPNSRMHRWWPGGKIEVYRDPSNMANGNTFDRQGRLLTCEHATSRVIREELNKTITVLATHFHGRALNSPNDIVVRSDGTVFFSDPTYGRSEPHGVTRKLELSFRGVFRLNPDHPEPVLIADDFDQPNGLILSLDERRLFINDTVRGHIRVFHVTAGGELSDGTVWAETRGEGDGAPDGLKIDSRGNVYCCGPGGIHVFDPEGVSLGIIRTPEVCANFAFGDEDYRSLFMTASTSLYRTRVHVPGRPLF
jgi:gluconolactonase